MKTDAPILRLLLRKIGAFFNKKKAKIAALIFLAAPDCAAYSANLACQLVARVYLKRKVDVVYTFKYQLAGYPCAAPTTRSRWLTPQQAADYLGCSRNFLDKDRVTRLHGIPFARLGRHIRYSVDDLDAFLERSKLAAVEVA